MDLAQPYLAVGLAEHPTRDPNTVRAILGAAGQAGLVATTILAERSPEERDTRIRTIIASELRRHELAADLDCSSISAVPVDQVDECIGDRLTLALQIVGDGWTVRLPLEPGFVTASFEAMRIDWVSRAAVTLCATLFDAYLSEWAVIAEPDAINALDLRMPAPTEPAPLPLVAPLVYVSPDVAHSLDLMLLARMPGVLTARSAIGASALVCTSDEAVTLLGAALAPALQGLVRPAVEVFFSPTSTVLLRDASTGLSASQCTIAGVAISEVTTLHHIPSSPHATLEGLRVLDETLGVHAESLPVHLLEGWSAYAGQVLVDAGGRWRRHFEWSVPFPSNLCVETQQGLLFGPHGELVSQIRRGECVALEPNVSRLLDE